MALKDSRDAAVLKTIALVGGIKAISMECVYREFNALLKVLGWEACLDREACKVLDLGDAGEALAAAFITDKMRMQDAVASTTQFEKDISKDAAEGAGGQQSVTRSRPSERKRHTTPLVVVRGGSGNDVPLDASAAPKKLEVPERHKNKKLRRDGQAPKMSQWRKRRKKGRIPRLIANRVKRK
jgi:hypothetical protein